MTGKGLSQVAKLKAEQPEEVFRVNHRHMEAVLEARRSLPPEEWISLKLRGLGYEIVYGYDSELGDYALAKVEGKVVAQVSRASSLLEALQALAGELGVRV